MGLFCGTVFFFFFCSRNIFLAAVGTLWSRGNIIMFVCWDLNAHFWEKSKAVRNNSGQTTMGLLGSLHGGRQWFCSLQILLLACVCSQLPIAPLDRSWARGHHIWQYTTYRTFHVQQTRPFPWLHLCRSTCGAYRKAFECSHFTADAIATPFAEVWVCKCRYSLLLFFFCS